MEIAPSAVIKEAHPEQPNIVRIAIVILYIQLALYLISSALSNYYRYRFSENYSPIGILRLIVIVPVYVLLVFKSSKGKTWARNLLLIWFIWNTLLMFWLRYSFVVPSSLASFAAFVFFIGLVGNRPALSRSF